MSRSAISSSRIEKRSRSGRILSAFSISSGNWDIFVRPESLTSGERYRERGVSICNRKPRPDSEIPPRDSLLRDKRSLGPRRRNEISTPSPMIWGIRANELDRHAYGASKEVLVYTQPLFYTRSFAPMGIAPTRFRSATDWGSGTTIVSIFGWCAIAPFLGRRTRQWAILTNDGFRLCVFFSGPFSPSGWGDITVFGFSSKAREFLRTSKTVHIAPQDGCVRRRGIRYSYLPLRVTRPKDILAPASPDQS